MADYLVTDTELTSIANAIRTKGGTSGTLTFPTGFVSAINDIQTGGGGVDIPVFSVVYDANYNVTSLTCNKTYAECEELTNVPRDYYAILISDETALNDDPDPSVTFIYKYGMSGHKDWNTSGYPIKYEQISNSGRPAKTIRIFSDETITIVNSEIIDTLNVTQNKTYNAPYPKLYSQVNVNVPNTYGAGDEGKVVSSGALVAQTSDTVTQNGTVDTTLINSLTVNVSGGGGFSADDIATGTAPNGAITLSSAITEVAAAAFYNKPITSVSGSAVTKVGDSAFQKCASLTNVTFPELTTINTSAFQDCTSLTNVSFPKVTAIGANAFRGTKLTSASFPLATSAGAGAFQSCQSLVSLSLPSVKKPGGFAYDCEHLTSIDLSACTELVGSTFQQCYALQFIDFPSLTKIGNKAFYNARKLSVLVLRRTAAVVTLDNIAAFTNTPFRGYNNLSGTIYVPSSLISAYQSATNWSTLYSGGHCTFAAIEGSQYE